jgi:D-alanyl-D-alanine dipeptidase
VNPPIKSLILLCLIQWNLFQAQALPQGFGQIADYLPKLQLELRYAGSDNFTGRPIKGYEQPKKVLTIKTLVALQKVQQELTQQGMGLKLFDGYRPQRAVNDFIAWSVDPADTLTKAQYYPNLPKDELFDRGYIAKRSGHSRGSTVDLTIIYTSGVNQGKEVDMGSPWDFFGSISWYETTQISPKQMAQRRFLQELMVAHGFRTYAKEWWHFTLKEEPFPNTYFDL